MPLQSSLRFLPEYCTVLAQSVSPDGALLAVGERRGRVEVHDIEQLVERREDVGQDDAKGIKVPPVAAFDVGAPVLSMQTTDNHLIIGSIGELTGYSWGDLTRAAAKKGPPEPSWHSRVAPEPKAKGGGKYQRIEVNCLCGDSSASTAGHLVVGGGDGVVRTVDVETATVVDSTSEHEDFIHCVSACSESGLIASAGEDGAVCLWDRRKPSTTSRKKGASANVQTVVPSKHKSLQRAKLGKWVGAVAISGEWMVCGGGPSACLWHLRTLGPGDPFEATEDVAVHVAGFVSDRVYIGGVANKLYQLGMTGEILSEINLSSSRAYSVAVRPSPPFDFLSCAGSSSRLDICSPSLSYKDRTVTCFAS